MNRWQPDHRKRVGRLIGAEIDRRGWSPHRAATELSLSERTVRRARQGIAAVDTLREVAERLDLPPADYIPPRDATEQTQLDRIEAFLTALLEHNGLSPADVLNAAADKKAAGREELATTLEAGPPPPDTPL